MLNASREIFLARRLKRHGQFVELTLEVPGLDLVGEAADFLFAGLELPRQKALAGLGADLNLATHTVAPFTQQHDPGGT